MNKNFGILLSLFALLLGACAAAPSRETALQKPIQVGTVIAEKQEWANGHVYVRSVHWKLYENGDLFTTNISDDSQSGSAILGYGRDCFPFEKPAAAIQCNKVGGIKIWTEKLPDEKGFVVKHEP